jgi:hypothetical protein
METTMPRCTIYTRSERSKSSLSRDIESNIGKETNVPGILGIAGEIEVWDVNEMIWIFFYM